jgi:hypothetical protein
LRTILICTLYLIKYGKFVLGKLGRVYATTKEFCKIVNSWWMLDLK